MLDIDRIRELVDMMVANDLVEISLRDGDVEVNLRRPTAPAGEVAPVVTTRAASPNPTGEAGAVVLPAEAPAADEPEADQVEIRSPMVGTFYAAPDPDSPPFVQLGSTVNPSTVVCIVEAMKVFNEIKAELSGTIQKILVKNEEPIEYGQPLFLVHPE